MTSEAPLDSGLPTQPPLPAPKPGPLVPAWAMMLIVLLYLGLLVAATAGSSGDTSAIIDTTDPNMVTAMKIAQVIAVVIIFICPSLLFAFLAFPERLRALKLHIGPKAATFFLVILLMTSALPVINWMAEWNNKMSLPESMAEIEQWMRASEDRLAELTKAFLADTSVGGLVLNLFVIALMAAISEELLFRGVIQEVFVRATKNVHAAVWITAILFSVIHLQFFGFFPRMMLGALLGYLFVWSRSLWVPILAHFTNNGLAVALAWLVARKDITADAETMGSDQDDMMISLVSALIVSALLFAIYTYEKRKNAKLPA
jgi:uncharacterized protein